MANMYSNPYMNNLMYNPYAANMPQYQQPVQQQNVQPTIQQGGYVPVSSEKEAFDYLVGQGTSVTFIDGANMKMYVKTKGFSPLEQPNFRKFNIVEILENENTAIQEQPTIEYVTKEDLDGVKKELLEKFEQFNKPTHKNEKRGKENG